MRMAEGGLQLCLQAAPESVYVAIVTLKKSGQSRSTISKEISPAAYYISIRMVVHTRCMIFHYYLHPWPWSMGPGYLGSSAEGGVSVAWLTRLLAWKLNVSGYLSVKGTQSRPQFRPLLEVMPRTYLGG